MFTVLEMKKESYFQLRQKFIEFFSQLKEEEKDDSLINVKNLFEEMDNKFNMDGQLNKELEKLRGDFDQV